MLKKYRHLAAVSLMCAAVYIASPLLHAQTRLNPASDVNLGVYPPWQHGENNDTPPHGLSFTEPDADNLADFHGNPQHPALVLYVGGNYFFAMAPLVHAFETLYPRYKGHIFWETIPPGLLVHQLEAGGTVSVGNMSWTVPADLYLAGLEAVQQQIRRGLLQGPAVPYVTNTLIIMVRQGNPTHITGLADLGHADLRLAMPNPAFEGIAHQIKDSLTHVGGPALVTAVYGSKVADGSTMLTHIHHRQTPLWIMQGKAQAGVTWQSEAIFQEQAGHPIGQVEIPAADNVTEIYAGAIVKHAAHLQAAQRWLDFIRSPEGCAIFERYGFKVYRASGA